MAKFIIQGRKKLAGTFAVLGAKNAAVKMLAASIMIKGETTIHNVPRILDILRMIEVIESIGVKTSFEGNTLKIDASRVNSFEPNEDPIKKLRGAVVIIGPLLSLFGEAKFFEPGGCIIGARPIDYHIKAFEDMGVETNYSQENNRYHLKANGSYRGGDKDISLEEMSVTTTENALMAAVLRKGKTTIRICACEPEIVDLANFLNQAGAKITGAGTNTMVIEGVEKLNPIEYTVMPDRIEAGTIAIAAAICGGKVEITNIIPEHLSLVLNKFKNSNVDYQIEKTDKVYSKMIVDQKRELIAPNTKWIDTRPYPGFPTDLQSPFAVLMTQANGRSKIFETLFEARFDYVKWLVEMGANIEVVNPFIVEITGPTKLQGKKIESSDLRGGAALLLAGLCAEGRTEIENVEFIDRGYENIDIRLNKLGASIERTN
jgi:UDP-N-acetylglucosamine 1-carboxyvinyltransferase